jgi:hypothetical protein
VSLYSSLRAIVTAGRLPVASPIGAGAGRALTPEDIERVRYPGEHEAAHRLRKVKGFRQTLKDDERFLTLHSQRHSALSDRVRLEPSSAPALFEALDQARALFGMQQSFEVYQDLGAVNASMIASDRGPLLTLQGPVLEVFSPPELRGLLGHELAHFVCHSGPDAPYRQENRVSLEWAACTPIEDDEREKLLTACALSVAQEVTADRFELLINGSLETYLTATLKFSTELGDAVLRHDPEVLLRQVRDALKESVGDVDRSSTHPERHLRVRAAEIFTETDLFRELTGRGPGTRPIAEANEEISRVLSGWVSQGATSIDQQQFERFLLATATAIAGADGKVRREERAFLARTLPHAWRGKLLPAAEAEALTDTFAAEVRRSGDTRARITTLNFLCGLVDSDGRCQQVELMAIDAVGRALGARDLFRYELGLRYFDFDPTAYVEGKDDREAEEAVREAKQSLLRYLDTVVVAGQRRTTLRRLLALGGHRRRSLRALSDLVAVLDASGINPARPLRELRLDEPVVLKADEA